MGDITTTGASAITQGKEGGTSSSIRCPMLTASNYTVWAIRMKILLKVHEAWDVIEHETEEIKKNDMAIALIFQSIPEALILQVGDLDNAKKVWEAIKTRHMGADRVKEARLQTLMSDFDRLKMKDTDTIDVPNASKNSNVCDIRFPSLVNLIRSGKVQSFCRCSVNEISGVPHSFSP